VFSIASLVFPYSQKCESPAFRKTLLSIFNVQDRIFSSSSNETSRGMPLVEEGKLEDEGEVDF
jgi:hypothetical protein